MGGGQEHVVHVGGVLFGGRVTVVVVRLVALRDDVRGRWERSGVDGHVWQREGANRGAAIVLGTPERAVTKGFRLE